MKTVNAARRASVKPFVINVSELKFLRIFRGTTLRARVLSLLGFSGYGIPLLQPSISLPPINNVFTGATTHSLTSFTMPIPLHYYVT